MRYQLDVDEIRWGYLLDAVRILPTSRPQFCRCSFCACASSLRDDGLRDITWGKGMRRPCLGASWAWIDCETPAAMPV